MRLNLFFSLFTLLGFALSPASADMLYLKNKNTLEGIIESEDKDSLTLNVGYGRITLKKREIEGIVQYHPLAQEELQQRWSQKYFWREEFVPQALKDLAKELVTLEGLRNQAIENKKAKDKTKTKLKGLGRDLEKLKEESAEVSAQLMGAQAKKNPEEYNTWVEKSNALVAEIRLKEYAKEKLGQELLNLEKKISDYITYLKLFQQALSKKIALNQEQDKPETKSFFAAVKEKLQEMEDDFSRYKVDYQRYGTNIVVSVLLNDLVNTNFIVDTGASLMIISKNTAKKIGLDLENLENSLTLTLADGRQVRAKPVILKKVKVGPAQAENVQAAVLEDIGREEIELLGMSFLENFLVTLEPKENKLILEEFKP